jgi:hypothetical protein
VPSSWRSSSASPIFTLSLKKIAGRTVSGSH